MALSLATAAVAVTAFAARTQPPPAGRPEAPVAVTPLEPTRASANDGIWIGRPELLARPTVGPAWENLLAAAGGSCGAPDLSDQESGANVCVMAKALVFARTDRPDYRDDVVAALRAIVSAPPYSGRALALGRKLAAYVVAADLIDLPRADPALDAAFRHTIRTLLTTPTIDGPPSLVACNERRPNNWGTHAGASRAAVAAYLGDREELGKTAAVFKGYLGDRASYAGFVYGERSWQCDPSSPVGVNPPGCTRGSHVIDGVLPDDQRRGGPFTWPAPRENYVFEALQGALAQAVILDRAGYEPFEWGQRALLRAFEWLHREAQFPPVGDDVWEAHVVNFYYRTAFPAGVPARPGKNVGWTDWTHAAP